VTFGEFSVDLSAGELRRQGEKIRIQDLPFRVLSALLARPGEVVTREELRASLWGAETFVDAEAGLNTAIAKLRDALDDRADAPQFIETLPKRGYRFIAPVDQPVVQRPPRRLAIAAIAILVCGGAAYLVWRAAARPARLTIAVVLFRNETGKPDLDRLAQQLTDATVVTLAQNPAYAVIGNAAILRTPRIFQDLDAIRTSLHADYILVAQVQEPPAGLIVRAHFIRARDQIHLWAKGITAPSADLEREVVRTIDTGIGDSLRAQDH
jgi:DNA-binding winged helix-turn-helix (wHTH) protein/TolB-like protein